MKVFAAGFQAGGSHELWTAERKHRKAVLEKRRREKRSTPLTPVNIQKAVSENPTQEQAAAALGISSRQLRNWIKKLKRNS